MSLSLNLGGKDLGGGQRWPESKDEQDLEGCGQKGRPCVMAVGLSWSVQDSRRSTRARHRLAVLKSEQLPK